MAILRLRGGRVTANDGGGCDQADADADADPHRGQRDKVRDGAGAGEEGFVALAGDACRGDACSTPEIDGRGDQVSDDEAEKVRCGRVGRANEIGYALLNEADDDREDNGPDPGALAEDRRDHEEPANIGQPPQCGEEHRPGKQRPGAEKRQPGVVDGETLGAARACRASEGEENQQMRQNRRQPHDERSDESERTHLGNDGRVIAHRERAPEEHALVYPILTQAAHEIADGRQSVNDVENGADYETQGGYVPRIGRARWMDVGEAAADHDAEDEACEHPQAENDDGEPQIAAAVLPVFAAKKSQCGIHDGFSCILATNTSAIPGRRTSPSGLSCSTGLSSNRKTVWPISVCSWIGSRTRAFSTASDLTVTLL